MDPVPIENIDEVRTLHRMLFKLKFCDGPSDEFFGSPFIADIQRRLLAALGQENPEDWDGWADADNHRIPVERFKAHVADSDWWRTADRDQRRDFAVDCLAPLEVSQTLLEALTGTEHVDDQG